MNPKIYLFGIPTSDKFDLSIRVHHDIGDRTLGTLISSTSNNSEDTMTIQVEEDINIGDIINLSVLSSYLAPYTRELKFMGGDISHVLALEKETNGDNQIIEQSDNYEQWQQWNSTTQNDDGVRKQNQYMSSNKINTEPLWTTYYESSKIDYLERFHRLWIGLNAYSSYHSQYSKDGKKIFDLVNIQSIKDKFHSSINFNRYIDVSHQLSLIQTATGVDTSSDILRLGITNSNPIIDFMEQCKLHYKAIGVTKNLVNDFIFLDKEDGINIFNPLYKKYHEYIASSQGMAYASNFSEIFDDIKSPKSIQQIGRLVFRYHLESDDDGSLFEMSDFYDADTLSDLYSGINGNQAFEQIDALFFRYLFLLYKFRSAYFHGDFILNHENNELAQSAYLSLLEIYPT